MTDLRAIESAITGHATEHVRTKHAKFVASCDDVEKHVSETIEEDVEYSLQGNGQALFACQDLCNTTQWRCGFAVKSDSLFALVEAAVDHFETAHPRLAPDKQTIRESIRSSKSQKVSWPFEKEPLHVRWRKC